MHDHPRFSHPLSTRHRRRRGNHAQSLTVAVIVLFLLLFVGGLFIALVINNLRGSGDNARRSASDKFAEAGLRYLDEQLTRSPEGADWRPVPDDLPGDQNSVDDPNNPLNDIDPNDPDYFWLAEINPGRDGYDGSGNPMDFGPYTRVAFGGPTPSQGSEGGRALVRIVYRPFDPSQGVPADASPDRKYLRLDSIGRTGSVDPADPTTFGNTEAKGLRRELVAYKAIGLTDYLRWFTNKENRSTEATIGAVNRVLDSPDVRVGRSSAAPTEREIISLFNGPIRSNAPLTFHGANIVNLDPNRNDQLEVSGPIRLAGVSDNTGILGQGDRTRVYINADPTTVPNLFPSLSSSFQTLNGLVRDNPAGSDTTPTGPATESGLRRTPRLEPPVIDEAIGSNGLTRYRALTRNAEPMPARYLTNDDATALARLGDDVPGRIGWGSGLYIDNRNDVQRESRGLFGGYSLRGDWLNPGLSNFWRGDFLYVPPAIRITFHPRYVLIERSPTSTGRVALRGPNGQVLPEGTSLIRYSGPSDTPPATANRLSGRIEARKGYPTDRMTINGLTVNRGDFVIFTEGNVELRGTLGGRDPETGEYYERHVTVVSNENIYIGGNLLRDNLDRRDPADGPLQGRSSIALLARNYVTLNTTAFLSPEDALVKSEEPGSDNKAIFLGPGGGPLSFLFRLNAGGFGDGNFSPWASTAANTIYNPNIFLRHGADSDAGTAVRIGVNDTDGVPNLLVFQTGGRGGGLFLSSLLLGGPTQGTASYYDDVFPIRNTWLYPNHQQPYPVRSGVGVDNLIRILFDQSIGVANQAGYRLSRFGIAPLEVRVEALLYAQERSLFIIPGPWFNPDPNDTYARYVMADPSRPGSGARLSRSGDVAGQSRVNPQFPFHGEPMDIRITFYGAIAENMPAEIGDQGAWLEKWGWVPRYYGSTGLPVAPGYTANALPRFTVFGPKSRIAGLTGTNDLGAGIVYQYDPRWEAPGSARTDRFGRMLPLAPRLPVAPGLLYRGDDTRRR